MLLEIKDIFCVIGRYFFIKENICIYIDYERKGCLIILEMNEIENKIFSIYIIF